MKADYQVGCGKIGAGIVTHYRVYSINSLAGFHGFTKTPINMRFSESVLRAVNVLMLEPVNIK